MGSGTTIGISSLAAAFGAGADVKVVVGGGTSDEGDVGPASREGAETDCFRPNPPHPLFSLFPPGVLGLPPGVVPPAGTGLSKGFDLLVIGLDGPLPPNGQLFIDTCFSSGKALNKSDPAAGPRGETGGGIVG